MSRIPTALRSAALAATLAFVTGAVAIPAAFAAEEVNITNGYAVHGYDVVAYHTMGKPTEGSDQFVAEHDGAKYRFASAENLAMFQADPAKFAPAYGGYCAFGTAFGRKFDGDPQAWRIVDGKLYLNLNQKVQTRWLEDPNGYINGADHNWAIIANVADKDLEANPPADLTQGPQ